MPDYLSRSNGRVDLAIVVLTFPYYMLILGVVTVLTVVALRRPNELLRLLGVALAAASARSQLIFVPARPAWARPCSQWMLCWPMSSSCRRLDSL